MSLPALLRFSVVGAALAVAACTNPLNPAAPEAPGTVVARVIDKSGGPLRAVKGQVHDNLTAAGGVYSVGQWTHADGVTRIDVIPSGRHRVEVTPPAGFDA